MSVSNDKSIDVVFVGNLIRDRKKKVTEKFLEECGLPIGENRLGSVEKVEESWRNSGGRPDKWTVGGSSKNVATAYHFCCQKRVAFLTKPGNDDYYAEAKKILKNLMFKVLGTPAPEPLSECNCFTTRNQRTMQFCARASRFFSPVDILDEYFIGKSHCHVELYLIYNPGVLEAVFEKSKKHGLSISVDLSDVSVLDIGGQALLDLLHEADFIGGNFEEWARATGKSTIPEMTSYFKNAKVAVITNAEKGGHINGEPFDAEHVDSVVDPTGAGDSFIGTLLALLLKDENRLKGEDVGRKIKEFNFREAARVAAKVAAEVVQVRGASLPKEKWESLFLKL